jgi:hypothetical protein
MKLLITLISLFIATCSYGFSECKKLDDTCEYYSCVEQSKHCGKRGYAIGFGQKYCKKFDKKSHKFTNEGRKWIEEVRGCLIDNLGSTSQELSCRKFRKAQVKNHIPCYLNSGYCSLSDKDKFQIKKVVYKTMWRPSFIVSAIKILRMCD